MIVQSTSLFPVYAFSVSVHSSHSMQRFFAPCVSRRFVGHTIHSSFWAYFYALSIDLNLYHSIFGSFCVRSENRFTQILAKFEALWRPYCLLFSIFFSYLGADMCVLSVCQFWSKSCSNFFQCGLGNPKNPVF